MKWTKDKPNKEGWYWARPIDATGELLDVGIYKIDYFLDNLCVWTHDYLYKRDGGYERLEFINNCEWSSDPIPEPTE